MHRLHAREHADGVARAHWQCDTADGYKEGGPANGAEALWVRFEASQEHQEDDADVAQVADEFVVANESERRRA